LNQFKKKKCLNSITCRGYQNTIKGKKFHKKLQHCPQNRFRKQMGLISRANLRKTQISFSRLELANKVVEMESKIEDYERIKNFGCVDCVKRNSIKINAETSTEAFDQRIYDDEKMKR